LSDPSMYWNTTTSVGSWHDPANMGSSVLLWSSSTKNPFLSF
jgi:hypothetical protein